GAARGLAAAMEPALLLTALAPRAGDRVDLLAFDRRVRARVVGAPRSAVLSAVAQAMAGLQPELVETDAAALGSAALTAARHRSLIVLLTDLNPAAVTEGLLPRPPLLAARHEVGVAAGAGGGPGGGTRGGATGPTPPRSTTRPPPNRPSPPGSGSRRCCSAAVPTW